MENSNAHDVHEPVLVSEVVRFLRPGLGGIYVDATLGLGGHAERILAATGDTGRVLGFEWDEQAAALAAERLGKFGSRFKILSRNYGELVEGLREEGIEAIDGLVLDLGASSLQFDRKERGFSFQADAPLDMRMDRRGEVTAADLVRILSKEELADIIYRYGEERQARRIADFIVQARKKGKIETTAELASIVAAAIPARFHPRTKHVATRTFQALRIAVNRELENLARLLAAAPAVLKPAARICVITFHSLEDRIVKQAFAAGGDYDVITRKPVTPRSDEVAANPRARSAKLRVAAKAG
jgi:16S rRNA (cytosine1402-N4)-methyltransferase